MALCDMSNRNPNVLYELGLRQAYDKPVVLVCDENTDSIFDVAGISTIYYSSTRHYDEVIEDRKKITQAINETRSGKGKSIVTIVKTYGADFSSTKVTQIDKIELLLQQYLKKQDESKTDIPIRYSIIPLINFS